MTGTHGMSKLDTRTQSNRIDWDEVRRRMEAAQAALLQQAAPTADEKKRILNARARRLARATTSPETPEGSFQVVEFILAYEKYALETAFISEVYPLKELTPLPCTPEFVLGIVNVRGKILSVVDIKKLFGLPAKGLTDLNKLLIVHAASMEIGILADQIVGIRSISPLEVMTSLPTLTGIRAEYLRGVTRDRVVILDVKRLLSDRSILLHREAEIQTETSL